METKRPRKYMLKITTETRKSIDTFLDKELLQEQLSELVKLPGGNIKEIKKIGSVVVLLWNFDDFTSCSSVSDRQFFGVELPERKLNMPKKKGITSNIGWSFFTLEDKLNVNIFTDEDKQGLDLLYIFPKPDNEMVRMNVLQQSLMKQLGNDYNVFFFDATKKTRHYCQFSGGGDLYITKRVQPHPLVFFGAAQTDDDDDDASTPATSTSSLPTGYSPSRPVSPVTRGTSKSAGLSIEGKISF